MNIKTLSSIVALASLAIINLSPAWAASTRAEVQALREEVVQLREGQEKIQADLAEIKKLLESGNRAAAAPAAPGFAPRDLALGDAPIKGSATAPVTLVEFSDYQCPFCKRHATTVFPELLKQYGDSGQVRFVMFEMPIENIHPRAMAASQAALCAGDQGQYWAMHDQLFNDQRALADADLKGYAATIGLDTAAFNACLDANRYTDLITAHQKEAASMGISGTPSFVVGLTDAKDPGTVHLSKYIRGAQPLPAFQAAIDELLKEAADSD
jgi:protein-disulfide isomerase